MKATVVAVLAMATAAMASCCKPYPDGYEGQCYDTTYGTPCCGVGKCNIFCCNCDDGCRQENHAFCLELAFFNYNLCGNKTGDWKGTCQTIRDQEEAACNAKYPGKRARDAVSDTQSPNTKGLLGSTDDASSYGVGSAVHDVFQHADADQDGFLNLEEYIFFMEGQRGTGLNVSVYADYFHSFDTDGDGKIAIHETSAKP